MSLLARATGRKGIDQEALATLPGTVYIPLENRQVWTDQALTHIDTALNIATFYACVRVLAESVASLPLFLYRRLPNGGKERATDHELYPTLHDAPNHSMTSFVWRELLVSHMASWGDHFSEITFDGLGRMQLWPIRPDRLDVRWGRDGSKQYDYLSPTGGRQTLAPGSVFHVPALSSNGLRGYSPVALHRRTLEVHNAAREFGRSFFRNGARPATVLQHPKLLSVGAVDRLRGQMDELRGAGNAGKTVVLEEGLTVHEIGVPPDDAQYIETRVHEQREIQKIFRMSPHMVGDLERSTNNNIEHQGIEFVVYTLRPWLVRIEQEIKAQLLFDQPDIFAEFLVDGLLRGDAKGRAEALAIRWQHGTLTADQWRAIENENPLDDGLGGITYVPVNYRPAGEPAIEEEVPEALPPQLRAVKSASVRCQQCSKLLAEQATPPYRMTCGRCKAVTEAQGSGGAETPEAVTGIKAAIRSLAEPPVVNVEVPAPQVNVDTKSFAEALGTLQEAQQESQDAILNALTELAKPKRRTLIRDVEGRLVAVEA